MTAREVKDALRLRHPATDPVVGVGQWTTTEEWMAIDLLAFNAWASNGPRYGRVGYEVKVSRADYRRELLRPGKRAPAVAFCHEFYFAVPKDLLKPEEVAYRPPPELATFDAYERERCPGYYGARCHPTYAAWPSKKRGPHSVTFGSYARQGDRQRRYEAVCPTCEGRGYLNASLAERIAPHLWIPDDVGLIEVTAGGCRVRRPAPKRKPTGGLARDIDLAQLVRHVSFRPDPRHRAAA